MQLSLDIQGARAFINVSERSFHKLRQTPGFPTPILIGCRLRWLQDELADWLKAQPRVTEARPEPPQLKGKRKRPSIAPQPAAWPPPVGAPDRLAKATCKRRDAQVDDASRPSEGPDLRGAR